MTEIITIRPQAPQAESLYSEPNLSPYQAKRPSAPNISNDDFFGSFADILDVVNPLQQIPGVATVYRELTGDTISSGARIAGGALLGGPIGLVFALANEIAISASGKDIGSSLFAMFTGEETATQLAANAISPTDAITDRKAAESAYQKTMGLM